MRAVPSTFEPIAAELPRHLGRTGALGLTKVATWVAVLCLLYAGYQFWATDLLADWAQEQLRTSVPSPAAPASAAEPPRAGTGAVTASVSAEQGPLILQIPRLDLDLVVLPGVGRDQLRRGPGLLPGTPAPSQPGNSVIAAHRTTWGAGFGRLDELRPGDQIIAGPAGNPVEYTVMPPDGGALTDGHRIVTPNDRSVARQEPGMYRLTLVTCHPRFSATRRLIVIAHPTGPEVATPPITPARSAWDVPDLDQLDFGNTEAPNWPELVPPGATALLIWVITGRLSTSPRPQPRGRRILRWLGWRTAGAAAAAVPLFVAFGRLAEIWPAG